MAMRPDKRSGPSAARGRSEVNRHQAADMRSVAGRADKGAAVAQAGRDGVPNGRLDAYEYLVEWCRENWAKHHHGVNRRVFGTEQAARRFLAKLTGPDRPDLAPLSVLRLARRRVGAWERIDSGPP
jgi:hypothetical protein